MSLADRSPREPGWKKFSYVVFSETNEIFKCIDWTQRKIFQSFSGLQYNWFIPKFKFLIYSMKLWVWITLDTLKLIFKFHKISVWHDNTIRISLTLPLDSNTIRNISFIKHYWAILYIKQTLQEIKFFWKLPSRLGWRNYVSSEKGILTFYSK